ncbi:unnamed protein product [Boreogadus saida]
MCSVQFRVSPFCIPWAARLPAFPPSAASASRRPPRTSRRAPPDDRHRPHGEHLQTTATDLTASTSRRPPRTSRRAPPSPLLKQDTIYFNTGDYFSSLTQMTERLLATIHLQLPAPDPLC